MVSDIDVELMFLLIAGGLITVVLNLVTLLLIPLSDKPLKPAVALASIIANTCWMFFIARLYLEASAQETGTVITSLQYAFPASMLLVLTVIDLRILRTRRRKRGVKHTRNE